MFLNDSAVYQIKSYTTLSPDNIQFVKAVMHEQHMESNADGPLLLNALLYANIS